MGSEAAAFQVIVNNKVQAGQWIEENKGKNFALGATQVVLPVVVALGMALVIYLAVMHGQTGHSWLQILDKSWHWVNNGTALANLVKFGVPIYAAHWILGLGAERHVRDARYRDAYNKYAEQLDIEEDNTDKNTKDTDTKDKDTENKVEIEELKTRAVDWGAIVGFNSDRTAKMDGWISSPKTKIDGMANQGAVKRMNASRVLGYLPIVSVAIGITRIKGFINGEYGQVNLTPKARILNFVRGVTEVLGIGSIFLPFDIIGGAIKSGRPD